MNNGVQGAENKRKAVNQLSPSQGSTAKMQAEQLNGQLAERNVKFRDANRKHDNQEVNAAKNQLEQRLDEQSNGLSRAAQANQRARKQKVKEKAAPKDRGAAEKRSLKDQSDARLQAREALSSMRKERPAKVSGKPPDRER
ncbi:MAG: hypothetical protein AAGG57_08220 [Pseudomonadota bacterium]